MPAGAFHGSSGCLAVGTGDLVKVQFLVDDSITAIDRSGKRGRAI